MDMYNNGTGLLPPYLLQNTITYELHSQSNLPVAAWPLPPKDLSTLYLKHYRLKSDPIQNDDPDPDPDESDGVVVINRIITDGDLTPKNIIWTPRLRGDPDNEDDPPTIRPV